jgi:lipopolysaccharide biosynthesis regulator YciM
LFDRAEEKLRNLLGSPSYRAAVLEKLAWVYEQQRDWRAALDIWRELPPEKQRERAGVAAHYCCELGEAALGAHDFEGARAAVAAARVHDPGSARAAILAARIAAAAGEENKALDLYASALAGSRTIHAAFEQEARDVLQGRSAELAERLRTRPPEEEAPVREPARFRCGQCGVASVTWHWRCPSCRSWDSLQSVQNRGL